MIHKVLVADDEQTDRELIQEALLALDGTLEVRLANDGEQACRMIEGDSFDVVFTDMRMPKRDGLAVLEKARQAEQPGDVVVITGSSDVRVAVEAMKKGCFDYLMKPISIEQLEVLLEKLREHRRLIEQNRYLQAELAQGDGAGELIGDSRPLKEALTRAMFVATTDATVLLEGESGTGKELVSRMIHRASPRAGRPFIRVNCAALSESVLESELFGHEKGAFTGAYAAKPGRFELADGGSLLLDEISETSQKLQAELLRIIEQKEFERVGGTQTLRVDVRVITTTNRTLQREVAEGRFREDLYYRLNVVPLVLPPLREREGDVDLLCRHFALLFAQRLGKAVPLIEEGAMEKLRRYTWPGNVRELQNLIQRLVIMDTTGGIRAEDIPPYVDDYTREHPRGRSPSAGLDLDATLEDIERRAILHALERVNGNRTLAAKLLNISTRTIRNKLKKYVEEGLI